jgi:hypothetical protein
MLKGIFATLHKLTHIYEKKSNMRIFLINVSGTGLDLTMCKLTEQQYSNPEPLKQLKPLFQLYGCKAEDTRIDIIDDRGEPFE